MVEELFFSLKAASSYTCLKTGDKNLDFQIYSVSIGFKLNKIYDDTAKGENNWVDTEYSYSRKSKMGQPYKDDNNQTLLPLFLPASTTTSNTPRHTGFSLKNLNSVLNLPSIDFFSAYELHTSFRHRSEVYITFSMNFLAPNLFVLNQQDKI